MAPISDETVQELKELVRKLDNRVRQLEAKLEGREPQKSSTASSMRMILMGPPGAGGFDSALT